MSEPALFTVEFSPPATKTLRDLPADTRKKLYKRMDRLKVDPRGSANCERMTGEEGFWRIRCGDYRIIYEIYDRQLIVHVVKISHRRDVYRKR